MYKMKLRVSSILLCAAMSLPFSACKKKEDKKKDSGSSFSPYYSTTNEVFSVPDVVDAGFGGKGCFVQTFCETDEYLEAYREQCCYQSTDEDILYLPVDENGDEITPEDHLLVLDEKGEVTADYDLNEECSASKDCRGICCTGDECWILTRREQLNINTFKYEYEYSIDCFHFKKGLTKQIDPDFGPACDILLNEIEVCDDGRIFLIGTANGIVLVLDADGRKNGKINLPETYDGGGVVIWNDKLTCTGLGKEGTPVILQYDEKKEDWTETGISSTDTWNRLIVRDGELFRIETSRIVRLGGETDDILPLEDVSVFGNVKDIRRDGDDLELLVLPMSHTMTIVYHLTPSDKKTYEKKKEFVIAGYNVFESPLPQLVEEMSVLHPEVRFVMRDYMDEVESFDNRKQKQNAIYEIMSLDIANGKAPDMYFDYHNDIGLGEMGQLGYLKDLSPYLEPLNKDDYFMEKITMGKKTPYCASLSFSIFGFEASPKYVENPDVWTFEDFYKSAENFTDLTCIQSFYSKQKLLELGVLSHMDTLISDGKADFESDDFLNLLKWSDAIGCKSDWDEYTEAALDDGLFMLDFNDYGTPAKVIELQEHILVGFPGENGSLPVFPYNLLAVSVTTSQPELAGEVIRHALSEEFQENCMALGVGTMSVCRKVWDQDFEETYQYHKDDPEIQKYSKEEYYDRAMAIVSRADHYMYGSRSVLDVVLEEAAAYFSGNCSAEHAAELIQNRVNTYLMETS